MYFSQSELAISIKRVGKISATIVVVSMITVYIYLFISEDTTIEETRLKEFSGIVLDKYRIQEAHDSPVVKIKSDDREELVYLNHYCGDVFENIQIGDTIYTKSGDSTVSIHRKSGSFMIRKMEYPAD